MNLQRGWCHSEHTGAQRPPGRTFDVARDESAGFTCFVYPRYCEIKTILYRLVKHQFHRTITGTDIKNPALLPWRLTSRSELSGSPKRWGTVSSNQGHSWFITQNSSAYGCPGSRCQVSHNLSERSTSPLSSVSASATAALRSLQCTRSESVVVLQLQCVGGTCVGGSIKRGVNSKDSGWQGLSKNIRTKNEYALICLCYCKSY